MTDDLLSGLGKTKGATAKPVPKQPSPHTTQPFAFPPPGDDPVLDLRPKTTDASGVKPKLEPTDQRKSSPTKSALSDPRGELQHLQLLKQTQELEIRKLELQLELAKITSVSSQPTKPSISDDISSKSMSNLKAPQKMRFPQPWPQIFTPGEPQLYMYSELSLPAFCAGYIAILQQYTDSLETPSAALLSHFHDLMVLACNYKWSAVRAYHYKVLRTIELSLVKWGDSFQSFKQPFFIPSALLPENSPKESKQPLRPSPSSSPIARTDICDAWSWYDDCTNTSCPKLHVCIVCKRPDHRALTCPKRRFPVPTRRQESASGE